MFHDPPRHKVTFGQVISSVTGDFLLIKGLYNLLLIIYKRKTDHGNSDGGKLIHGRTTCRYGNIAFPHQLRHPAYITVHPDSIIRKRHTAQRIIMRIKDSADHMEYHS